jgi:OOP family OmpA-OmpF porin
MAIAYGQESLPENPINWKIPNEHHSFAANYFNRLTYLLTRKDLRHKFPEQLASAQFNYDCWLEEQEENWQEDDINICKADLIKHVTFLEKHSQDNKTSTSKKITQPQKMEQRKNNKNITKKPQKIVQNEPKTTQKASKKARAPVHDMMQQQAKIFFEFNNTELNPAAKHNLDRILGGLEQADSVTLNSFTKIKGDEFHNMKLSRQRAMIVKDYLKNKGINDNKIDIFAYGEDEKSYNENNKHHSFVITLSD